MQVPYLEITFRHGSVLAAYYYLPRVGNQHSTRSERLEAGLVVDYDVAGNAIGIEITAPRQLQIDTFNRVLLQLGKSPIDERDLAPLRAA
jgi:hypothetical protein